MDTKPDKKVIAFAIGLIILGMFILPLIGYSLQEPEFTVQNNPVEKTEFFTEDTSKYPTMLKADGTDIVNANGEKVVLKGVAAADPHRLNQTEVFSTEYYQGIFDLGGNVIRVPVQPGRYLDDQYYIWRYLDLIVKWAGENNSYVIIDWACAGNPATGKGDNMVDIADDVTGKSCEFWKAVAYHFRDVPNVIFEIFNEPIGVTAQEWAPIANEIINAIRTQGANQLIIVGSIDSGYDINWTSEATLKGENLAIGMQVYPYRTGYSDVIDSYSIDMPLIVTAWGFAEDDVDLQQNFLSGTVDSFGKPLMECLNEKNISWVACYHDDSLEPTMYKRGTTDLTRFGKFVVEELAK